ncbi:hypothetical protein [Streptomyces violascens]|uniref:hypothetical protein n=1 Tax=Streptomyces violascens TaxID=67381 RepID=UPI0036820692
MRKTTKAPALRRLAAAAVALGSCLALAGPAASAGAAPADPVPTVFFGDSYTANFGIAPFNEDGKRYFCFQAKENYPAVATRRLADKGITLDVEGGYGKVRFEVRFGVRSDVSPGRRARPARTTRHA